MKCLEKCCDEEYFRCLEEDEESWCFYYYCDWICYYECEIEGE